LLDNTVLSNEHQTVTKSVMNYLASANFAM